MNMLILIGILAVFGLMYYGTLQFPTTGLFADIPASIEPHIEKIGNPFMVMTWIAIILIAFYIIAWMRGR